MSGAAAMRVRAIMRVLLLGAWLVGQPLTAAAPLNEYEVKAAFLFQFTRFVEWPPTMFPDAEAPLVVGVLGQDPFGDHLRSAFQGRTAQGRQIVVRHVRHGQQLQQCHLLFVSASEEARIPDLLRTVGTAGVLTVGDSPGFAEAGGAVNFVIEAARVKLEVNMRAAERARIRISSKMLTLARIVDRGGA